jgi:hypothetical protein
MPAARSGVSKAKGKLLVGGFGSWPAQGAGNLLFEHLQGFGRVTDFRFADQQVHMLGHHHVADQPESKPRPHLIQNPDKPIPRVPVPSSGRRR